ncbi:hypothetical protein JCM1840_000025 [Sporobolomyces johnsonii]
MLRNAGTRARLSALPRSRSAQRSFAYPASPPTRNWRKLGFGAVALLVGGCAVTTYSIPQAIARYAFPEEWFKIPGPTERRITQEEMNQHRTRASTWVAIDGKVFE